MKRGLLSGGEIGNNLFVFLLVGQVVVPTGLVFHNPGTEALDRVGNQDRGLALGVFRFLKGGRPRL